MRDFKGSFDGARVLVVGGAGFVGSNLVKIIINTSPDAEVVIVDNLLSAQKENIPDTPRVKFIEGPITDDGILNDLEDNIDYIFHLATYHGNQSSIHDPLADHENNTLTTLKLLNRVSEFKNIKKVVYSSAGCSVAKKTFDTAEATNEDAPLSTVHDSPYSISKIVGEFYCNYYHRQYDLPAVCARFQNVFGPGEILGAGQWRGTPASVWRNVTPVFVYKGLKNMPIPLENEGVATRDFIFVEDICAGLIHCALWGEAGEVYNIATGKEISIKQLADIIIDKTGNTTGIKHLPRREWDHSGKRFGSIEKSRTKLGFEAAVDFEDGLIRTIEWTKQNMDLIERCIDQHAEKMKDFS